jgi:predicted membrane protein
MPASSERPAVPAPTTRTISFFVALAASLTLMLFPFLLRYVPSARLHAGLSVVLLGVAGALVYGIGYRPDNRLLRLLFGPKCAWSMMIGGALLLFAR